MDNRVYTQQAIKEVFYEHLCKGYTEQLCQSSEALEGFLSEVQLPSLDPDSRESLDAQLSKGEEVPAVFQCLKPAKTPGSDGLPAEFYHRYAGGLADQLLEVNGEALQTRYQLAFMQEAMVVMILKPDYHPISLLNMDVKILSGMLVAHLLPHMATLKHPAKLGFILRHSTLHNLRRLAHVYYAPQLLADEYMLALLDNE
ncbi:hypothetical protein NDU88_003349 [Pleurodeles waltl]|uniref:Uncharacterized protein n=1 Tax=Pleurodeles waltl TaxID=8319 RepID=A0AAV7TPB0_PLEWA|nr:hypothetical protein NDU88_003349 [Pleurodeles waltl]